MGVQWLEQLPHSKKVQLPAQGLSVCSLPVIPVSAWVLSSFPGFLPQSGSWDRLQLTPATLSAGTRGY